MLILQVILVISLAVCAAAAVYWIVAGWRLRRALRMSISMREGLALEPPSSDPPSVAVVIPAHDEEALIESCARGILAQDHGSLHVIFVLDRCTDRTEARLRSVVEGDARCTILVLDECPPDWAGKCNAASQGARKALELGVDYLLFTDADTRFDPGLVRAAVGLASRERADLVSVLSTLTCTRWDEKVVQPVASFNLLRMHPTDLVNRPQNPRAFANGQFMLFSRAIYEGIGGHHCVHEDLLEDIAFARKVRKHGGRGIIVNSDGMLRVAMYDSLQAMREGWKRIFIEVARRQPRRLMVWGCRAIGAGVLVPAVQVAALVLGSILYRQGDTPALPLAVGFVAVGVLAQLMVLRSFYRTAETPLLGILGYPFGCLVVGQLMFSGAADLRNGRPIRWGGRDYLLTPR
ncbi:MAG: glycosyltransferase family 2 protein [Planctomycetota bacterium]|nr:glycosyltransferase family 2 protein [Planctomycetota bacterium]MEC9156646.1 glycosyltransferase family 2 protein [Planctomycetota bacterium]